jgi:putative hydrolase
VRPAGLRLSSPAGAGIDLAEDYHVHSTFSDGASTLEQNLAAAARRGLHMLCLVDHVRRDTGWIPEFRAAVGALRPVSGLEILCGLEAKILDRAGHLDIPAEIGQIDLVLIADHQFPSGDGPVGPAQLRAMLAAGRLSPAEAVECLVEATANAAARTERPLLAHLFSVLPKAGLSELDVPGPLLAWLARRASQAGALVEVNEKWSCPSARVITAFARAGVPIVASTDSHDCRHVGRYSTVRAARLAAAT